MLIFFRYGKGFGIIGKVLGEDSMLNLPNGFLGTMFYGAVALLCMLNHILIKHLIYCYILNK